MRAQHAAHRAHGQLGRIVLMAQMAQHRVAHARLIQLQQRFTAGFIAQVPIAAQDARLELRGIMIVCVQHIDVMVAFQQHDIRARQRLQRFLGKHADIRGRGHAVPAIIHAIAYRLRRVVRDAIGHNARIANVKGFAAFKHPAAAGSNIAQGALHGLPGAVVCVNRHMVFAAEDAHALDMIAVLVRNQDTAEGFGQYADAGKPLADRAAGQSRVNQQPGIACTDIYGVSAGA